jgi:hypothetical protein
MYLIEQENNKLIFDFDKVYIKNYRTAKKLFVSILKQYNKEFHNRIQHTFTRKPPRNNISWTSCYTWLSIDGRITYRLVLTRLKK